MHESPGNGRGNVKPFSYGTTRSLARRGRYLDAGDLWARLEPNKGDYRWQTLDEWIDDNPGKTFIYTMLGTPPWQSNSTTNWGYGFVKGGASPPTDLPAVTAFIQAMFAHLLQKYGSYKIKYLEVWNEPGGTYKSTGNINDDLNSRNPNSLFWQGSMRQLAQLHVAIKAGLPPGVLLTSCAWEGQHSDHAGSTHKKLILAMQEIGKMSIIDVLSKHGYTYNGYSTWHEIIDQALGHINFRDKYYKAGTPIMDSELGAENPIKLWKYEPHHRAGWLRCTSGGQIALGLMHCIIYTWRTPYASEIANGSGDDLPVWDNLTNNAITGLHNMGGAWIYRTAITSNNHLWISYIQNGVQKNQLWKQTGEVVDTN